jgi:hypothetical protein
MSLYCGEERRKIKCFGLSMRDTGVIMVLVLTVDFLVEGRVSYLEKIIDPAYPPVCMFHSRTEQRGPECKNYTIRIAKKNTFPARYVARSARRSQNCSEVIWV